MSSEPKYDPSLREMRIEMRFGNGGLVNVYSPRVGFHEARKQFGWFIVRIGANIMFGRKGWHTYLNCEREAHLNKE